MNKYIQSKKRQRRARVVRIVAGVGCIIAGLWVFVCLAEQMANAERVAGFVDGVAAVERCEADGGSGYILGSDGAFRCLYD